MGCKSDKCKLTSTELLKSAKTLIQAGDLLKFQALFTEISKSDSNFDINSYRISINHDLTVTLLGFSLIFGRSGIFTYLLEDLGSNFDLMEELFSNSGTTGLSIICSNNYLSLLQIYLPLFLKKLKTGSVFKRNPKSTLVLDQSQELNQKLSNPYTPIQLACENGHISIINYFKSYFSQFQLIPSEVDLHYIEPVTGNNCALIACQENNFLMMKFLFCQCAADFEVINSFNENAINVLAVGSAKNPVETLTCLQFLIEKVKIDPVFNWQESLLMLEEEKSVKYLEGVLSGIGINLKKNDLEDGELKARAKGRAERAEEDETQNRFTFVRMFPELAFDFNCFGVNGEVAKVVERVEKMGER